MELALNFVQAINEHNVEKIVDLMSDNHTFIDTYGNIQTREEMKVGWKGYFEWFPDYLIEVEEIIESDNKVAVFGYASGTYLGKEDENNKHWHLPAVWRVTVKGNYIAVWQVYCDSKKQFDTMQLNN